MYRFAALIALFFSFSAALAQVPDVPVVQQVTSASSTAGLELPPDQTVGFDEGFVTVQAKCQGEVRWFVVSQMKVKYFAIPQTNNLVVSIPPQGGVISVFAVGLVDGKMTDFVRTNITVAGQAQPGPQTQPGPQPQPQPAPTMHVSFITDKNSLTPQLNGLLNSETLRNGIRQRGSWFRWFDVNQHADILKTKRLEKAVRDVGGSAVMIIQADDGRILTARTIPQSEQEVFAILDGRR